MSAHSDKQAQKSPADVLADIGRLLYGDHWRVPLCDALEVRSDTMRRWMTGRMNLTFDHPAFDRVVPAMVKRAKELTERAQELVNRAAAIDRMRAELAGHRRGVQHDKNTAVVAKRRLAAISQPKYRTTRS